MGVSRDHDMDVTVQLATGSNGPLAAGGPTEPIPRKSSIVKTDKPRPHVCQTCTRSFARLEHLKRHERSHTKEKPFECPVCERCFARRDLLLRHKQKLHAEFSDSSRPRPVLPSASATASHTRKNSTASGGSSSRSRQSSATSKTPQQTQQQQQQQPHSGSDQSDIASLTNTFTGSQGLIDSRFSRVVSHDSRSRANSFSAVSASSYAKTKDMEELSSRILPENHIEVEFSTPQLMPVHLPDSDMALDDPQNETLFINPQLLKQDTQIKGFEDLFQSHVHTDHNGNADAEHALLNPDLNMFNLDHNSLAPGQSRHQDDNAVSPTNPLGLPHDDFSWMHQGALDHQEATPQSILSNINGTATSPLPAGDSAHGRNMSIAMLSPPQHSTGSEGGGDNPMSNPATVSTSISPPPAFGDDVFGSYDAVGAGTHIGARANSHANGRHQQGQVPAASNHGDMRDHKAFSSQIDTLDSSMPTPVDDSLWPQSGSMPGHASNGAHAQPPMSIGGPVDGSVSCMTPQSIASGPTSVPSNGGVNSQGGLTFPAHGYDGTAKGQIITPQLRLHILTTLSAFSSHSPPQLPSTAELQRYINAYNDGFGRHIPFLHQMLEITPDNVPLALSMAAIGALYSYEQTNSLNIFEISRSCIHVYLESRRERKQSGMSGHSHVTPLWLVQALVLGVVYGLFISESMANEIAVAQANAVISLAKSAGLHLPPSKFVPACGREAPLEERWRYFIAVQERIRTMHVVHSVSCLLATAYNVPSNLKSGELKCGSPCDESLWTAGSAQEWWQIVRMKELDSNLHEVLEGPNFGECLDHLLQGNALMGRVPQFALLSLMYAIHLEIYERRSKQLPGNDAQWIEQEKGRMEAILRAWETTWSLSPLASLSPSNEYGPLMADSIPLSSLAHIRTHVDLRAVKEAFWKRDFGLMNHELDNLYVAQDPNAIGAKAASNGLLEAASYSADAISLWEKHSVKWALKTTVSRTFVHTLVSLFDCGLVVSEFLARLERRPRHDWSEDEIHLASRLGKIFYRVVDVVGSEDLSLASAQFDDTGFVGDVDLHKTLNLDVSEPYQGGSLSVLSLLMISKVLSKTYIWPFALVMGDALRARAKHLKAQQHL